MHFLAPHQAAVRKVDTLVFACADDSRHAVQPHLTSCIWVSSVRSVVRDVDRYDLTTPQVCACSLDTSACKRMC